MAARDYQAVIAKLRLLLAKHGTQHLSQIAPPARPRRATLAEAAAEIGLPLSTLHDVAKRHRLSRRRRSLSPAKARNLERMIRDAQYSVTKISRLLKISKSTASTKRRALLDTDVQAEFRPRKVKQPRRCPRHGLLNEWPCVACKALGLSDEGD